jgi:hypothetical protein
MGSIRNFINVQRNILSLKQDIEMVKEELNSEEKFFEKAVMTEKFVKKYKNIMIGSVIAVVVLVGANVAYNVNKQNTIEAANTTVLSLKSDSENKTLMEKLHSLSPTLYDAWKYQRAVQTEDVEAFKALTDSKALLVSDLAAYNVASMSKDVKLLTEYTLQENAMYKDLATVQIAILLMEESKIKEAREKLALISIQSPLAQVANALMHYGVK